MHTKMENDAIKKKKEKREREKEKEREKPTNSYQDLSRDMRQHSRCRCSNRCPRQGAASQALSSGLPLRQQRTFHGPLPTCQGQHRSPKG